MAGPLRRSLKSVLSLCLTQARRFWMMSCFLRAEVGRSGVGQKMKQAPPWSLCTNRRRSRVKFENTTKDITSSSGNAREMFGFMPKHLFSLILAVKSFIEFASINTQVRTACNAFLSVRSSRRMEAPMQQQAAQLPNLFHVLQQTGRFNGI